MSKCRPCEPPTKTFASGARGEEEKKSKAVNGAFLLALSYFLVAEAESRHVERAFERLGRGARVVSLLAVCSCIDGDGGGSGSRISRLCERRRQFLCRAARLRDINIGYLRVQVKGRR